MDVVHDNNNDTHLEFTAMVYPPEQYVSSSCNKTGNPNSALQQDCREYTGKEQLIALVSELNDKNNPLPILCEHEANTLAGRVKCAKLTPGKGILVTMSLDTTTEHGRVAASKVSSGEWAYVSLGHEFVATKNATGNRKQTHGYDVKKTAREVSCCALGARNQTAIIERLDEHKWEAHAAKTGTVLSSAHADASEDGAICIANSMNSSGVNDNKKGNIFSFHRVLIGEVVASSVLASKLTLPGDIAMTQEEGVQEKKEGEIAAPPQTESIPNIQASKDANASEEKTMDIGSTAANTTLDPEVAKPIIKDTKPEKSEMHTLLDEVDAKTEQVVKINEAINAEVSKLRADNERYKREADNHKKEAEAREIEQERVQSEVLRLQRQKLKDRLAQMSKTTALYDPKIGEVTASVLINDTMDVEQSEHIVCALEKATEGYIAASDSQKQLQKQLADMSSAVGIAAGAQRENEGSEIIGNKRKASEDMDTAVKAEGMINASADGAQQQHMVDGLPKHTADFKAGKISYEELIRSCDEQRQRDNAPRMSKLCGTVNASAESAPSMGLGFKGGFSASAQTAYSQYCNTNARRLLPSSEHVRQDYPGMGLKQVNPALWNDFMSINNSFERTGVPAFVKGQIMASLNSYEHKR